jgi:hypothetical protein
MMDFEGGGVQSLVLLLMMMILGGVFPDEDLEGE